VTGAIYFISVGFVNDVDELNGDGSVGGGSGVVVLGTILGLILGGVSGIVSGFVAGVFAAAVLVPYKGKQSTIGVAAGLAAASAAAVSAFVLTYPASHDRPPTIPTLAAALMIVLTSPWLVSGYLSRAAQRSGEPAWPPPPVPS
jgi:hypothetical protein